MIGNSAPRHIYEVQELAKEKKISLQDILLEKAKCLIFLAYKAD